MKLKTKLVLTIALLVNITLIAQDSYTLTGVVTDLNNQPVPAVNVIIQNTTTGTSTDFDGNYSINVSNGDVLQFSSLGYASQKISITSQTSLNIKLNEDSAQLDEVVVVGYGTRKKSHLTGAVAKVGGEEVAGIQAARVDDALAGKLPGVLIQNQSGEPGAAPKIQVRAASSLSGDSNPLIVVDGYPISGSIATVNPNDIESLEVLKDAASAAIYGSRGANGVILITTKKGKAGKANFSYNGYTSFSQKYVKDIEMLKTAGEWAAELQTSAYDLSEINPGLLEYRLDAYENAPDVVSMEDWLFQNGSTQSHDFSVSGGSENVKAFASLGYQNTEGIVIGQGFEKINARLNLDAKLGDRLTAGLSFNGFRGKQDIVPHDMRDLLRAYSISPIYHTDASIAFVQQLDVKRQALYDGTGGVGIPGAFSDAFDVGYRGSGIAPSSIYNLQAGDTAHDWHYGRSQNGIGGTSNAGPAAKFDNAQRFQRTYFANVSANLQYEIIDGLKIKTVLGGDLRDTQDYYAATILADAQERTNQTDLDISDIKVSSVLSETTLNYAKVFDKHDVSVVGGIEFQNTYIRGLTSVGTNLPYGAPLNYNQLTPADVITSEIDEMRSRRSVFGRINYAYDDRYLLSVSARRDGDSRFGANNRFATFPSLSLGWNVHNEAFFGDGEAWSLLKLRFSTGSLGTTSFLGSYDALSVLGTSPTVLGTGFEIPDNLPNPDLTWQTNTETNYGLDLGFVNNRIRLSADYYTSDVEDMLINQSVPEILGVPSIVLNLGDVKSSGLELTFDASIIQKEDFRWSFSANLSTVNTEITSLGNLDELPRVVYGGPSSRGPEFRNYVGGEVGEMWGYESAGEVETIHIEDPTRNIGFNSGLHYIVDQNNDGVIDDDDWVKLGSATPDFYWGLSSSLNYKAFDLAIQFQGSQGAEVYNIDPIYWQSQFGDRTRASFDANNDGIADANGLHYDQTRFVHGSGVQDASYIALRNLTLGYTLDSDVTNKVGLSSVRLYVAGSNLLYLFSDDYTSFNPEGIETTNTGYLGPTTYGYQEGASPIVRSFTLGLNVNF